MATPTTAGPWARTVVPSISTTTQPSYRASHCSWEALVRRLRRSPTSKAGDRSTRSFRLPTAACMRSVPTARRRRVSRCTPAPLWGWTRATQTTTCPIPHGRTVWCRVRVTPSSARPRSATCATTEGWTSSSARCPGTRGRGTAWVASSPASRFSTASPRTSVCRCLLPIRRTASSPRTSPARRRSSWISSRHGISSTSCRPPGTTTCTRGGPTAHRRPAGP